MLVACLTSLVALNGKNHAGTGNSAAFTVTQPLERAQNDAFGPPNHGGHMSPAAALSKLISKPPPCGTRLGLDVVCSLTLIVV